MGWALSLSTFVIATTIGTPAALTWLIDSIVCGITPSSAATIRITTSVTWAPRARISVKASWPGVSMKVTLRPSGRVTWLALMCWVMPPASWAATSEARILSSSVVLPWSTWPRIVTTGGRARRSSGLSFSSTRESRTSSAVSFFTKVRSSSSSRARISRVSWSSIVLTLTIMPWFLNRILRISAAL